jgi:hypothetical protein
VDGLFEKIAEQDRRIQDLEGDVVEISTERDHYKREMEDQDEQVGQWRSKYDGLKRRLADVMVSDSEFREPSRKRRKLNEEDVKDEKDEISSDNEIPSKKEKKKRKKRKKRKEKKKGKKGKGKDKKGKKGKKWKSGKFDPPASYTRTYDPTIIPHFVAGFPMMYGLTKLEIVKSIFFICDLILIHKYFM